MFRRGKFTECSLAVTEGWKEGGMERETANGYRFLLGVLKKFKNYILVKITTL